MHAPPPDLTADHEYICNIRKTRNNIESIRSFKDSRGRFGLVIPPQGGTQAIYKLRPTSRNKRHISTQECQRLLGGKCITQYQSNLGEVIVTVRMECRCGECDSTTLNEHPNQFMDTLQTWPAVFMGTVLVHAPEFVDVSDPYWSDAELNKTI